jgi:hypothetical protein
MKVPEGKKEAMWQLLSITFILLRGTKDKVKHHAQKMLGEYLLLMEEWSEYQVCQRGPIAISKLQEYHTIIME